MHVLALKSSVGFAGAQFGASRVPLCATACPDRSACGCRLRVGGLRRGADVGILGAHAELLEGLVSGDAVDDHEHTLDLFDHCTLVENAREGHQLIPPAVGPSGGTGSRSRRSP